MNMVPSLSAMEARIVVTKEKNRGKHSDARHDALSNRASILSRVMMLYPTEQAFCRAS